MERLKPLLDNLASLYKQSIGPADLPIVSIDPDQVAQVIGNRLRMRFNTHPPAAVSQSKQGTT